MSIPCALFTSCSPSLTADEVIRRKYVSIAQYLTRLPPSAASIYRYDLCISNKEHQFLSIVIWSGVIWITAVLFGMLIIPLQLHLPEVTHTK